MSARSRLKLPREHGAWAMLFVPMALGFSVAGTFNVASLLLIVSATLFFISRESLVVWLRARARGRDAREAKRLLLIYLSAATIFGAPLLLHYRLFALAPLAISAIAVALINTKTSRLAQRTALGESLAIAGLTITAPAAFYAATGKWSGVAWLLWALCAIYFASSIYYVKLRVADVHARDAAERIAARRDCAVYHFLMLGLLAALAFTGNLQWLALAAFGPVLLRSFAELARPASKLNLKRAGFLEILYSLVFLVFITLNFH
ncbi:MAG: hypothetical protein DMF61_12865 [Blastocatellia bacterium AA13]|nr:MAG: hypothetical protein DMF61_12865 [Blastocatellia bacterium AA13]